MATKTVKAKEVVGTKSAQSKRNIVKTSIQAFGQKFNFTFEQLEFDCVSVTCEHNGVKFNKTVVTRRLFERLDFLCEKNGCKYAFEFSFSCGEVNTIFAEKLEENFVDDEEHGYMWKYELVEEKKFML